MKPFVKDNLAVILAFALPILLVVGIALNVYLPGLFLSTKYNFVYATCGYGSDYYYDGYYPYNCANYLNNFYKIENGKLTTILVQSPPTVGNKPYATPVTHLFLHDSQKNEGREITLAEAQKLDLNGLITSPDGVSVENAYDRGPGFFPFFDDSTRYGYYLTKGGRHQKLNLVGEDERNYYYRDRFKFIGWVIQPNYK